MARASLIPFVPMPHPREFSQCACGEPLTLEMEHDVCQCVECQRKQALRPTVEQICAQFRAVERVSAAEARRTPITFFRIVEA